jgi:hypothetical protein
VAKQLLGPNSRITINGVDLSDHCTSVTTNDETEEQDVTGFKQTYREMADSLKTASIETTFIQDYASGSVDATVGSIYYGTTSGTIKVNPDTTGTVVYTLVGRPNSYNPVSGGPGDASTITTTWSNRGTAGLTRGTS